MRHREFSGEILLVGQPQDADLESAITATFEIAAQALFWVRHVSDVSAAVEQLQSSSDSPWLIVVLQSWPGQIAAADIDRLRRAAPIAAICGLLGSWCEGETRSGKPWPGAFRVAWNDWPARLASECRRASLGIVGGWSLPSTIAMDELLLERASQADADVVASGAGAVIAVLAETRTAQRALADAALVRGYRPTIASFEGGAAATDNAATPIAEVLLWDTTIRAATDAETFRKAVRLAPGAPIIALLGFPRVDDISRARAVGVSAVVAKPYLLSELFWQIAEARKREGNAADAVP